MAFAVPVIKKDYDLYSSRRRSAPASSLNKMTTKYPSRRRVISATYSSTNRPTVTASDDSVLSQSVDRRHVHFGVCQEIRYSNEDDDDKEAEDELTEGNSAEDGGQEEDDSDFADSVDSGRSSLDSAEESDSKERINEEPQKPPKMPTSILRRSNQDIARSPLPKVVAQDRPKTVRTVLQFLVAKCAPKKN